MTSDIEPIFPPGFWRRIVVFPHPGTVVAGLEDDVHRFGIALAHNDDVITRVAAQTERAPWSTCMDAGAFLSDELTGERLDAVTARDPHVHCTHLLDLAIIAAAHANDRESIRFDMQVADRTESRTTGTLLENDVALLQWRMDGTLIEGPEEWKGRDLRQLSRWRSELSPEVALQAMLLRRAIFVSGARRQPERMAARAADMGPGRLGACFTHQMPRAAHAVQSTTWRQDFSRSTEGPLQGFDPNLLLAAVKEIKSVVRIVSSE